MRNDIESKINICYPSETPLVIDHSDKEIYDHENAMNRDCDGVSSKVSRITSSNPPPCLSLDEARKEAKTQCIKLFENWNTLKALLKDGKNEALLWNRWWRMKKRRRIDMLLRLHHTIPLNADSHLGVHKQGSSSKVNRKGSRFRKESAWPNINVQGLTKEMNLPLFIQARGHHPPHEFVLADHQGPFASGWTCADPKSRSSGYYMPLRGTSAEQYAKVATTSRQNNIKYGDALDILEVQNEVLHFLVRCAQHIISDKVGASITKDTTCQKVPSIDSYMEGCSLGSFAAEAPYRPSNPARLSHILEKRRLAASFHLWNLRNDPCYFSIKVKDFSDHSCERIEEESGDPDLLRDVGFWKRVVAEVIRTAYQDLFYWRELNSLLEEFNIADRKCSNHRNALERGNHELLSSCRKTRRFLDLHLLPYQRKKARDYFPASPPWRHFFERHSERSDVVVSYKILTRKEFSGFEDSLLYSYKLFARIADEMPEGNSFESLKLMNLSKKLARLVTAADTQDKVSRLVFWAFSDLGIVTELQNQLSIHRYANLAVDGVDEKEPLALQGEIRRCGEDSFENGRAQMQHIETYLSQWKTRVSAGMPYMGNFGYEIRKSRSRAETEAMQREEMKRDVFWDTFDKAVRSETNGCAVFEELNQRRYRVHRTPDWV